MSPSGPLPSDAPVDATRVDVVAAVIRRGERVLVCRRPPGAQLAGQWEFPGGKVDADESREQAMARELAEELDLELAGYGPERFAYDTSDGLFRIHFVEVRVIGDPRAIEHTALRWLRPSELATVALASGDRAFADVLLAAGRHGTGHAGRPDGDGDGDESRGAVG